MDVLERSKVECFPWKFVKVRVHEHFFYLEKGMKCCQIIHQAFILIPISQIPKGPEEWGFRAKGLGDVAFIIG